MPDGSILRVGDSVKLAERYGNKQVRYKMVLEDVYSTVLYGGGFSEFSEALEEGDVTYNVFYVDKGSVGILQKFKSRKKLDGTIAVQIILESKGKNDFSGTKRVRGSLESFEKGELVKIE